MGDCIKDYELLHRKVQFNDKDHDNKVDKDEISLLDGSNKEEEILSAMKEELGISSFEEVEGLSAGAFNRYLSEMGRLVYNGYQFATSGEAIDKKRFNASLSNARRAAGRLGLKDDVPNSAFKARMTAIYEEKLKCSKKDISVIYNLGSLLGKTKADIESDLAKDIIY